MPEYLILLYRDEEIWQEQNSAERQQISKGHVAFQQEYQDKIKGGNALELSSTATTLRAQADGGVSVTDGPFAETKEALAGYYLIEAADLDEALEMARSVPLDNGGTEVRPIRHM
jgi:hypothetical protein